jgi:2-alkenal reductase
MDKNRFMSKIKQGSLLLVALLLSLALAACGSTTPTSPANSTTSAATTAPATTEAATTSTSATNASTTVAATTRSSGTTAAASGSGGASAAAATATVNNSNASPSARVTTPPATTGTNASPNTSLSADQVESNTVVGVVNSVSPAVVTVYNKARSGVRTGTGTNRNQPTPTPAPDGSDPGLRTQGIGSGVIINDQGYIVTNAHVVEGEQGISVAFNNGKKVVTAKVVGVDKTGDLAVLKVDGPVPAVAKFGDSSKLQVGETVIAIGAALGDFRNSVTKGIVSGLNRTVDNSPSVYVQTDTPINHGNSGGPLLNLRGEIVGINTLVVRSTPDSIGSGSTDVAEGLGFAIPSNTAKLISDQLISKGSVSRPYFGITYQMITPAIAGTTVGGASVPAVEGAWIYSSRGASGVVSGSPADKAGLKNNDVITAVDGITLNDNNPLVNVMLNYKPGDTIKLTVQRNNQTLTLSLTLGERPSDL